MEGPAHVLDASLIVPQHDGSELTIAVIHALRRHEPVQWPIIVVDDGSVTNAADDVQRACPDVCVLRQQHSGVTAAWSRGLSAVTTPFVVLLNNDVTIAGRWVDALLQPLREGEAMLSGAELRRERALPAAVLKRLGRAEFVAGWCWAVRKQEVRSIGGFDAALKFYFSDTDLQARLLKAAPAANEPFLVGGLPLQHAGHRSMRRLSNRRRLWEQDRARFIQKWTWDSR